MLRKWIRAFVQFVHDHEDGGDMATCHNAICRWAARLT